MVTLKERYKNLKTLVVERKEPFTRLMHHLETETAWLTADPLLQNADTWSGFVLENPQKKRKLHSQQFTALCR